MRGRCRHATDSEHWPRAHSASAWQKERVAERRVKPHQYRSTHKPCSPLRENSLGAGHPDLPTPKRDQGVCGVFCGPLTGTGPASASQDPLSGLKVLALTAYQPLWQEFARDSSAPPDTEIRMSDRGRGRSKLPGKRQSVSRPSCVCNAEGFSRPPTASQGLPALHCRVDDL